MLRLRVIFATGQRKPVRDFATSIVSKVRNVPAPAFVSAPRATLRLASQSGARVYDRSRSLRIWTQVEKGIQIKTITNRLDW